MEHQVEGTAHSGVVKRLFGVVDHHAMNGALVEVSARHPWGGLRLLEGYGVKQTAVVDAPRQERRPQFRREASKIVKLDAIEVRQAFIPVVAVLFYDPDFFIDASDVPERTRARVVHDTAQVVVVVLQRLLAHDDVPARGKGRQHETGRAGLVELELDSVGVAHVDLADARKQRRTRTTATTHRHRGGRAR